MTHPERAGTVAIVPARGGSKGVRGKNLQEVGGKSLIGRTVTTAAACVQTVVVTTDCPDIAAEAERHGAVIVERPAALAEDATTSEVALLHALDNCSPGEWFAFLQCTSPFLTVEDLGATIAPVRDGAADVAFTAADFHGHIWGSCDSRMVGVNFDAYHSATLPRQARPKQWLETGAAYAIRTDRFRETGCRFFGHVVPVECDPLRAVDIDTPGDLALARALAPILDGGR